MTEVVRQVHNSQEKEDQSLDRALQTTRLENVQAKFEKAPK
jgi:hypothetical protein